MSHIIISKKILKKHGEIRLILSVEIFSWVWIEVFLLLSYNKKPYLRLINSWKVDSYYYILRSDVNKEYIFYFYLCWLGFHRLFYKFDLLLLDQIDWTVTISPSWIEEEIWTFFPSGHDDEHVKYLWTYKHTRRWKYIFHVHRKYTDTYNWYFFYNS